MRYIVRRIKTQTAIESCERAGINEVQWNGRLQPEAWAYMGYLEGKGLFVRMACGETNPLLLSWPWR